MSYIKKIIKFSKPVISQHNFVFGFVLLVIISLLLGKVYISINNKLFIQTKVAFARTIAGCGESAGDSFAAAPATNLCAAGGVPSSVTLAGSQWIWSCNNPSGWESQSIIASGNYDVPDGVDQVRVRAVGGGGGGGSEVLFASNGVNGGNTLFNGVVTGGGGTRGLACLDCGGAGGAGGGTGAVNGVAGGGARNIPLLGRRLGGFGGVLPAASIFIAGRQGGGGDGGNDGGGWSGGGGSGGGSGGFYQNTVSVTPGALVPVVIGAGGNSGGGDAAAGQPGMMFVDVFDMSCTAPVISASCNLPWGGTIAHGASITAYSSNLVLCGASCSSISQTRVCDNGTLSGTYINQTCSVASCSGPSVCIRTCGNGAIDTGESCDQGGGNITNGDGCSSACQVELNWTCVGAPSICTPNTQTVACVGLPLFEAVWNGLTTVVQTWTGTAWAPSNVGVYNVTPGICTFSCNPPLIWNSTACITGTFPFCTFDTPPTYFDSCLISP